MKAFGDFADQEAPCQRPEHDEFRTACDLVKYPRQYKAAENHRRRNQRADPADRHQDDTDLQIAETRLDRKEQDREDVLKHQYAQRDAPRQRVEFTLFVENLDDDNRA